MRLRSGILVILAATSAATFVAACGAGERAAPERVRGSADPAANAWHAVPASPLSARETALGLWTGREVLFMGGSDARPCPSNASCAPPDAPPLADGASFDATLLDDAWIWSPER
jgi:hypothetical protein